MKRLSNKNQNVIYNRRPMPFTIRMTPEEAEHLRNLAHRLRCYKAELLRQAVVDLLVKYGEISPTEAKRIIAAEKKHMPHSARSIVEDAS